MHYPKLKRLIIKKLRLRYCTIDATKLTADSIARPLCDSRVSCNVSFKGLSINFCDFFLISRICTPYPWLKILPTSLLLIIMNSYSGFLHSDNGTTEDITACVRAQNEYITWRQTQQTSPRYMVLPPGELID